MVLLWTDSFSQISENYPISRQVLMNVIVDIPAYESAAKVINMICTHAMFGNK